MTRENKEPTCKHTHTNLHKCPAKTNEIALPQWQVKRIHEHTHTYTNLPLQLTQWRCHRMICLAWPNFSFFFLLFFLFSFLFFLLFCCLFFKFLFAFIVIICIAFLFRCNWLKWFFSKETLTKKWSKKDLFWLASMTGWLASKNLIELDELMNEQMNKWTNEWITEWVNEWMSKYCE